MKNEELIDLLAERDEAFTSMDVEKIKIYMVKAGAPPASSEKVFWASVHKTRTMLPCIDETGKELSRRWLIANGFKPTVSTAPYTEEQIKELDKIFRRKNKD